MLFRSMSHKISKSDQPHMPVLGDEIAKLGANPLQAEVDSLRLALASARTAAEQAQRDAKRLLNVAKGCHDYGGGYHGAGTAEIFHHGIQTVINALEAAAKNDPNNHQVNALERIGSLPSAIRGEGETEREPSRSAAAPAADKREGETT